MSTVHEQMHEGTCQDEEERKRVCYVYKVLLEQEVTSDGPDHEQTYRIAGSPEGRGLFMRLMIVIHSAPCLFRRGRRLRVHHHLHHHLHHVHALLHHLLTVLHAASSTLAALRTAHAWSTHAGTTHHAHHGHAVLHHLHVLTHQGPTLLGGLGVHHLLMHFPHHHHLFVHLSHVLSYGRRWLGSR